MSKSDEIINTHYRDLCQKLGDLTLRNLQIKEQIESVKDEITFLLQNQLKIRAMEHQLKSELDNERPKCASCSCSAGLPSDESGTDGKD